MQGRSDSIRCLIVIGTRPEAIKLAPVVREIKQSSIFSLKVCLSGQHEKMAIDILNLFGINWDYMYNIIEPNQSLASMSSKIMININSIVRRFMPNIILTQGDTTTAFITSLVAFYNKIDVGHVEAGLRTNNKYFPFPEEINRSLISKIAKYHFAPTIQAKNNLLDEGIIEGDIYVTGNTVIDTLYGALDIIHENNEIQNMLKSEFSFLDNDKKLILLTSHRRENIGDGLESICKAMRCLASRSDVQVVCPVHVNPNVRSIIRKKLYGAPNIILVDHLDYISFVYLMSKSYLIITDSGGIQEEAPSLGKPVLVLRESTERPEAVIAGTVILVGTTEDNIIENATILLNDKSKYLDMAQKYNPYGDGNASKRIIDVLRSKYFNKNGIVDDYLS